MHFSSMKIFGKQNIHRRVAMGTVDPKVDHIEEGGKARVEVEMISYIVKDMIK